MKDLSGLFAQIAAQHPEGKWTSLEKAQVLAALVVGLRPKLIVEVGVWEGDSIMPMLLALRHVACGTAVAIDPWSAEASMEGQEDVHREWWSKAPHEAALETFRARMVRSEVDDICEVIREKSDHVNVADLGAVGLVHIDANHGPAATRDIARFAPRLPIGGVLVLDDLEWPGGGVLAGYHQAVGMGFVELYRLGTGCVMQRTGISA